MTCRHVRNDLTIAVALFVLGSSLASAQCGEWLQPPPFPGVLGTVASTTLWDEDSGGPLPPAIVMAGSFQVAGDVVSHKVVAWISATGQWRSLAPQSAPLGFDVVFDALGCPDGRLVLSGASSDG